MKYNPWPYQEAAKQWILDKPECALFLDMGLGKTVVTLTAIDELMYDRFEITRVLVIAPLRVAEDTWLTEARKWDHLQHLRISRVLGSRNARIKALNAPADIYVINRENVPWLCDYFGKDWPFDMIVIDELSSFKSATARRFRALRKSRVLADRVVGLTGTPAPNGLIDLWPQVYLLDRGERLGSTITAYRARYFVPGKRSGHIVYEWKLQKEADAQIHAAISDICVSMTAADYLTLPERIDRTVNVHLNELDMVRYLEMERDMLLELADTVITAGSAAAVTTKLLQLASGAVYDQVRQVHELHQAKLDSLEDVIEASNGQPVLVFYAFRHDVDRIKSRFPDARELTSVDDIAAWNRGEAPILLAHPASAGHGLNLQAGGSVICWFGLPWSLELYQQANGRLYRQGQQRPVIIHHLVAEGTIDEDVMKVLQGKAERQDALIEAVKARLDRIQNAA
jgi:SNF2 family DNA or RNA helicase